MPVTSGLFRSDSLVIGCVDRYTWEVTWFEDSDPVRMLCVGWWLKNLFWSSFLDVLFLERAAEGRTACKLELLREKLMRPWFVSRVVSLEWRAGESWFPRGWWVTRVSSTSFCLSKLSLSRECYIWSSRSPQVQTGFSISLISGTQLINLYLTK